MLAHDAGITIYQCGNEIAEIGSNILGMSSTPARQALVHFEKKHLIKKENFVAIQLEPEMEEI